MAYEFKVADVMKRSEDGVDTSALIIIECRNTTNGAMVSETITADKAEFAKWPPTEAAVKAYAEAYLETGSNADDLKAKAKVISDSPMNLSTTLNVSAGQVEP